VPVDDWKTALAEAGGEAQTGALAYHVRVTLGAIFNLLVFELIIQLLFCNLDLSCCVNF
jgi:hypothetical protein